MVRYPHSWYLPATPYPPRPSPSQVRAAAARLLVACASVRTLAPSVLDDFVSEDVLLARLTLDAGVPAVAEPITEVLVHSFFRVGDTNTQVGVGVR